LIALLAVALWAPPTSVRIESMRAPHPSHCLADGQWRDPVANSPIDLFDSQRWWTLCERASLERDYALEVRLAAPVRIDRLRLSRPPSRSARRVEVHFHDHRLSRRIPIYFREVNIGPDGGEARLRGPLEWNPNLLDDEGFRARREAAGLDAYEIPTPLEIDGLTFVIRELEPGKARPALGPVSLWLDGRMLPLADAAAAREAHAKWLAIGLERILRGHHLLGGLRVLSFDARGLVYETEREAWDGGHHGALRVRLGRWRIAKGRLEFASEATFLPVEYTIDDAPHEVWLQTAPLAGVYRLVKQVPGTRAPPPLLVDPPALKPRPGIAP